LPSILLPCETRAGQGFQKHPNKNFAHKSGSLQARPLAPALANKFIFGLGAGPKAAPITHRTKDEHSLQASRQAIVTATPDFFSALKAAFGMFESVMT
jgi:hypothetical protein